MEKDKKFKGFPEKLVEALFCQKDFGVLRLRKNSSSEDSCIYQGVLKCSKCGEEYEIKNGILFLIDKQNNLHNDFSSEIVSRNKEAGKYDSRLGVRYYKEVISTLKSLGNVDGKNIIEYGCGTGRISQEYYAKCGYLLAIDFSLESLIVFSSKIQKDNVGLILGDATQIKTKNNYFDLATSFQFIEHIPTQVRIENFFRNVNNTLKLNTNFVCTAYHQDIRRVVKKQEKRGYHKGGIFYYYFSKTEMKNIFSNFFKINEIKLIDITLPLEARFKISQKIGGYFSRLSEKFFPLNKFSHLVLVNAKKDKDNVQVSYYYPSLFFKKKWFWFQEPRETEDIDFATFFSYQDLNIDGFKKKEGETVLIDLTQNLDLLWENMRKSFVRKQIKRGKKNKIKIYQDNNFEDFKKVYFNFRKGKNISKDKYAALERSGILFSAYFENKIIAGGIFISDGRYARALVLASDRLLEESGKMKEIMGQANRMVIWEAVKTFKEEGYEILDLGGVNTKSNKISELSLAEFKKSFGGEVEKCYYYSRVYSKLLKFLINLRRKLKI